ncbi:MAG: hypothetical protein IKK38_13780 [Spirochaetaceae bacterium]|nr:hypothetical protein [Spirochaetaceae bacterium]
MNLKRESMTEQSVKFKPKTRQWSHLPSPVFATRKLAEFAAQFFQVFVYKNLGVSPVLSKSLDLARSEIQTQIRACYS